MNSPFGGVASAGLLRRGAWCGFAQSVSGGGAHPMRAQRASSAADLDAVFPTARCLRQQASIKAEVGSPRHSGRAEQRSGRRIRAGACLSEASLRLTPPPASSARNPEGARPVARLSFAYFSLAKQRKVSRPRAETQYSQVSKQNFPSAHSNAMTKEPFFSPPARAEQRSGARIRAGACLSEASLRPTPSGASSAGQPAGPRSSARLSFAYFSLAKQRKVRRPQGRNPVLKFSSSSEQEPLLCFK